ncbi:hypothetical protein [Sphingomonas mollis]|uniref:Uncharacterized protein n=1 Tax=Sphingomonas mollis TaxID=2795726 RepID=A0ABS0XRT7_9SPHN|nr:hypothetical protein [Sphingomonas sp. BT553]MBJ6122736.1 hypothetical protein [Sphingomonas sp. BT553]
MIATVAEGSDWIGRLLDLCEFAGVIGAGIGGLVVLFKNWRKRLGVVRWPRRRTALRRLHQLRQFHANPRLLIAYVARRGVGLAMVGSAILLNDALYAGDHIRALSGHPMTGLRWELLMAALAKLSFVTLLVLGGADTVERIDDWATFTKHEHGCWSRRRC